MESTSNQKLVANSNIAACTVTVTVSKARSAMQAIQRVEYWLERDISPDFLFIF